jgi:hypothetical protein
MGQIEEKNVSEVVEGKVNQGADRRLWRPGARGRTERLGHKSLATN